jgi:O-antigen ligase/Tfp pilus assembly protein PilF
VLRSFVIASTIFVVKTFEKIIFWLFGILLFLVPLILWPFTSEVFEFNKIVVVYLLTILITATWGLRMIYEKKFIFRRTILDVPLLVFLGSQLISTVLSIDPGTSWLGYYSRFNGGMFSLICYALLYWAFVSNIDAKKTVKLIYVTLISATLVSVYGVLEHFGIDKSIWVQDVQSRVFSTLGQPNWLASWLVALMPAAWVLMQKLDFKSKSFWVGFSLSALFYLVLLFTGSRSALLGFGVAALIFWGGLLWLNRKVLTPVLKSSAIAGFSLILLSLIVGTQFTPSLASLIKKPGAAQAPAAQSGGTVLEYGGTESGTIRRIVWKGAVQVWLHYPIFGTGVESFGYSYYLYRPAEHNLTSEWDFIYNKAHNEYLNFAANSGTVGIISYLVLIGFSIFSFIKLIKRGSEFAVIGFALIAGYVSLLVCNFFGFSVVPTDIQFFLFPAVAFAIMVNEEEKSKNNKTKLSNTQKVTIGIVAFAALYLLIIVFRYWNADTLFAKGKSYNSINKPDVATQYLTQAVSLEPSQPVYYGELATSYARIAVALNQQKEATQSTQVSNLAIAEITKAVALSPANVNLKRIEFGVFIMLSSINPNYLLYARDVLVTATAQAPTDAKLLYNLGLIYARVGQTDLAMETLKKTIAIKADYRDARLAYAYLLISKDQNQEARDQLNYILEKIAPTDSLAKQALESIK